MKKTTILTVLLALVPAAALAQNITILPGGRGNIFVGTPMTLPSPYTNPVISPRISLPAPLLTPALSVALNPTLIIAAAAVEAIPAAPKTLPSAIPSAPIYFPSVTPALGTLSLSAGSTPDKPLPAGTQREKLDEKFDGRKIVEKKDAVDPRGPFSRGRHVSLPEQDLESEIGAY